MAEPWRPALQAWLHLHLGVITVQTLIGSVARTGTSTDWLRPESSRSSARAYCEVRIGRLARSS